MNRQSIVRVSIVVVIAVALLADLLVCLLGNYHYSAGRLVANAVGRAFLGVLLGWIVSDILLCCGCIGRWILLLLTTFLVGFESIIVAIRLKFNLILSGEWIVLLSTTNLKELWGFVYPAFQPRPLLIGGLILTAFLILGCQATHFYAQYAERGVFTWGRLRRLCVTGILLGVCYFIPGGQLRRLHLVEFCKSSFEQYRFYGSIRAGKRQLIPYGVHMKSDVERPLVVYIIGESATRNSFGVYGYGRDTTPNLSRMINDLFLFKDVQAAGMITVEAMVYMMTDAVLGEELNISHTLSGILKRVGYRVVAATAQSDWGRYEGYEGYEQLLFNPIDEKICAASLANGTTCYYDDVLLGPICDSIDRNCANPTAYFIHMAGSHAPFVLAYDKAKTFFMPDQVDAVTKNLSSDVRELVNHYDNTLRAADEFIAKLIAKLKSTHRPAVLVYISDHGETPFSGHWRVVGDRSLWEVPMIVWCSDEYRRVNSELVKKIEKSVSVSLQADQLLPGLSELFMVEGYGKKEENFLSPSFRSREQRLCLRGGKSVK